MHRQNHIVQTNVGINIKATTACINFASIQNYRGKGYISKLGAQRPKCRCRKPSFSLFDTQILGASMRILVH